MPLGKIISAGLVSTALLLTPGVASASPHPLRAHVALVHYRQHAHNRRHRHHRTVRSHGQHLNRVKRHLPIARIATGLRSGQAGQRVVAPGVGISGTTYYVSPSGSDSNSGTSPGQAWQTVGRVNRASLAPGDGVLFAGGQTFSDSDLEPAFSGSAAAPIVYGSYGSGNATITKGAWFVQDHLVFSNLTFKATFFGGSEVHGASNSITLENCTISLPAGNSSLGVYTNGQHWTIVDNTIQNTGLSGLLLNGDDYQVAGNTINNVGLDTSAGYNAHGVYLDASNATITNNTITNFSESAVSARYHDSVVTGNFFSGGQIGIDFYQTDPVTGTSHWTQNTIQNTTDVGIYVSSDGVYSLGESFVISENSIKPSTGGYTNLDPTVGTYTVTGNIDH